LANSSLNSEGKEVHINIITTEEASLEDSIKEAGIEVESNSQKERTIFIEPIQKEITLPEEMFKKMKNDFYIEYYFIFLI
jgi:hypothetical protein